MLLAVLSHLLGGLLKNKKGRSEIETHLAAVQAAKINWPRLPLERGRELKVRLWVQLKKQVSSGMGPHRAGDPPTSLWVVCLSVHLSCPLSIVLGKDSSARFPFGDRIENRKGSLSSAAIMPKFRLERLLGSPHLLGLFPAPSFKLHSSFSRAGPLWCSRKGFLIYWMQKPKGSQFQHKLG